MTRRFVGFAFVMLVTASGAAFAQTPQMSSHASTNRVEVTAFPGGALFATAGKTASQPGFQNFVPGGAVTFNLTQWIGIEGEVAGAVGIAQDLASGGVSLGHLKTPSMLGYDADVRVNLAPPSGRLVPYAVGGIGGVRIYGRDTLGLATDDDFLTGNVGGGLRMMFGNWGVRGDYRFFTLRSTDTAPAFIGSDLRYAHRVYGGIVFVPGRSTTGQ